MKKAYLHLGNSCNNSCINCFVDQINNGQNLETDVIKKILDSIRKESYDVVAFTGGEPTIRKDLFELVRYAKSIGLKNIELQTNGRMLSYIDYAKKVRRTGFSKVYISIHSNIREHHELLTRVRGSWAQTMSGIRNALEFKIPLMTNTVVNGINYKDIPDTVAMLSGLGVREIELDFIRFRGNAGIYFNALKIRMSDAWPWLRKAFDISKKFSLKMIYIDDYPICLMEGYEKFNSDYFSDGIHDETAKGFATVQSHGASIHENEKIYMKKCTQCLYGKKCQGIWKEYIEFFGEGEFKPQIPKK